MKLKTNTTLALLFAVFSLPVPGQNGPSSTPPAVTSSEKAILEEYDRAIDRVAERAMQSVVEIEVTAYGAPENRKEQSQDRQTLQRQRAIGSGVIVDPDGYIVTNNHVVAGALRIRVTLASPTVELVTGRTKLSRPQQVYEAKLIGTNRLVDLAVIKIEDKNLPCIPLPEFYDVRLGQSVIAIGAPEGLDYTVTKGIISALGRQPDAERSMVYVQTDAPINPGNSGGPLVDRSGNLVGINTFIFSSGGGSEGLGFAIPEPIVRFVYNELKAHGIVPAVTIGAHAQSITAAIAAGMKLARNRGVIFSDIDEGGPAAAAGLQPKDIVTAMDAFPIDSLPMYTAYLYIHKRGTPIQMQILRDGKPETLSITPVDAPPLIDSLSDLIQPARDLIASLGIFVIDLNDSLAGGLGSLRSRTGVLVAGILGEEPATLANLEVGDVIRSIDGKSVNNSDEFRRQLATFKPGDAVVLEVERQSVLQYVAFEIE
jgi:serine protease Do